VAQFTAVYICKEVSFTLQDLVQQKEEKDAFWVLSETNTKVYTEDGYYGEPLNDFVCKYA